MRNPLLGSLVGVTAALALLVPSALAQYGAPALQRGIPGYNSAPVSPYINLLQRGTNPAINYYGLVRPTINFQNSMLGLQQEITQTNAQVNATDQALLALPDTGHAASFMNTSHYFGGRGGASLPRGSSPSTTGASNRGTAGKGGYGH